MPKRYYAYIPFKPDPNTAELDTAIERWRTNVAKMDHQNEQTKLLIAALTTANQREGAERMEIAENTQKIIAAQARLLPAPILRKSPVILRHDGGATRPLLALDALDPNDYVLYVAGHCAPGSNELRNTQSFYTATDRLTGTDLVARMAADGLPKQILHVKLLACYGASANPHHAEQKGFAEGMWRALRGYCDALVRMKAYTEPVLVTSFYGATGHKTYGAVTLGQPVTKDTKPGGRLGDVAKTYQAQPCFICGRPILKRCNQCKRLFCTDACFEAHVDEDKTCRL